MTKKEIREVIERRVSDLWIEQCEYEKRARKAESDGNFALANHYTDNEMQAMRSRWELLDLAVELKIKVVF